jgi:hypothetical protein
MDSSATGSCASGGAGGVERTGAMACAAATSTVTAISAGVSSASGASTVMRPSWRPGWSRAASTVTFSTAGPDPDGGDTRIQAADARAVHRSVPLPRLRTRTCWGAAGWRPSSTKARLAGAA